MFIFANVTQQLTQFHPFQAWQEHPMEGGGHSPPPAKLWRLQ